MQNAMTENANKKSEEELQAILEGTAKKKEKDAFDLMQEGLYGVDIELPNAIQTEQNLLGCLMYRFEEDYIAYFEGIITPSSFYEPTHQNIYRVMLDLHKKGKQTMMHAVYLQLKDEMDSIGGNYLQSLLQSGQFVYNAPALADIIRDYEKKRNIIIGARGVIDKAADSTCSADDAMEYAETNFLEANMRNGKGIRKKSKREYCQKALQIMENAYQNSGKPIGISTGFYDLDKMTHGFHNSDLIIIAARPAMGKTSLMLNMAENAARALKEEGGSVGIFSLEMSADQLLMRHISMATGISITDLRSGNLNADMFGKISHAVRNFETSNIEIDDRGELKIGTLSSYIRKQVKSHNMKIVFVDYLQLLYPRIDKASYNKTQEITEISRGLKEIAKEFDIPVVALSQLSRDVEKRQVKIPQLSDLRDSGSIEQDADIVMFVHREEYYLEQQPIKETANDYQERMQALANSRGKADIIVSKHRNGATGMLSLHFEKTTTKFKDLETRY